MYVIDKEYHDAPQPAAVGQAASSGLVRPADPAPQHDLVDIVVVPAPAAPQVDPIERARKEQGYASGAAVGEGTASGGAQPAAATIAPAVPPGPPPLAELPDSTASGGAVQGSSPSVTDPALGPPPPPPMAAGGFGPAAPPPPPKGGATMEGGYVSQETMTASYLAKAASGLKHSTERPPTPEQHQAHTH